MTTNSNLDKIKGEDVFGENSLFKLLSNSKFSDNNLIIERQFSNVHNNIEWYTYAPFYFVNIESNIFPPIADDRLLGEMDDRFKNIIKPLLAINFNSKSYGYEIVKLFKTLENTEITEESCKTKILFYCVKIDNIYGACLDFYINIPIIFRSDTYEYDESRKINILIEDGWYSF